MKNKYKHYSFDLWNTLISPNQEFKTQLYKYFHDKYNPTNMEIQKVSGIINEIQNECKTISNLVGTSISPMEMYCRVLYDLKAIHKIKGRKELEKIQKELEELFLEHPPTIFSEDTISSLKQLKKNGATLSILSNNGFTSGKTIMTFLKKAGIDKLFSFHIYSGDVDISKTNENIFLMLKNDAYNLYKKDGVIHENDIVHIGNNIVTDVEAPKSCGIDSLIINTNEKTIIDIL